MKRNILFTLLLIVCCLNSWSLTGSPSFFHIGYADGLSDNKINCLLKSSSGYLWIGTSSGLNRYDGVRIRTWFAQPGMATSLQDNTINNITEDADQQLWLNTTQDYCIFNPRTEQFNNNPDAWLRAHGINGHVSKLTADSQHNLWILTGQRNLYYYDFSKHKAFCVITAKQQPRSQYTDITVSGQSLVITYNNGLALWINTKTRKPVKLLTEMYKATQGKTDNYQIYIDHHNNFWIYASNRLMRYDHKTGQWRTISNYLVKDIGEDQAGRILLATDHNGLVALDAVGNQVAQWLHSPTDLMSLPDNTLQTIYTDPIGIVWIGTYRLGLAAYYCGLHPFSLLPLGDVCSMAQTGNKIWLATNDKGIVCYDLNTQQSVCYDHKQNHLGSDIIVTVCHTSDGSVWFGSYQGGLARWHNGSFTVYRQKKGGLASDNVWALCELPDHRLAIGTLGAGMQLFNPTTGQFVTINSTNSQLPTDYISSLVVDGNKLIIGHSCGLSIMNIYSRHIRNFPKGTFKSGKLGVSPLVNQAMVDSRHLIWIATTSDLCVYDQRRNACYAVPGEGWRQYIDVTAVAEEHDGKVWVTTGDGIKRIIVKQDADSCRFFVNAYSEFNGVQKRLFNKRSILCLNDGRLMAGGIDGINVIDPAHLPSPLPNGEVLFSGLLLFDRLVGVGESINGHVILNQAIDNGSKLTLSHAENNFAIQLATTLAGINHKPRFLYRMRGLSDQWMLTAEAQTAIKFNNLPSGHYHLDVRLVDANGKPLPHISTLDIVVKPPFYLSTWAWLIYLLMAAVVVWYLYQLQLRKRRAAIRRMERAKQQELEEMKMVFFTNISHELRTPLSLILSPLPSLINRERDGEVVNKLRLIQRNAYRMLRMVNDILDLRRLTKGKEQLRLQHSNLVACVNGLCKQFIGLTNKDITLTMLASAEEINMDFDVDKVSKIVENLLSNAFKYAPTQQGRIEVSLRHHNDHVDLVVADNGPGITDADKQHLFERFFQSQQNARSGTGIGLNLVATYAQMHGGKVSVGDSPQGGAMFTVTLPLHQAEIKGKSYAEAYQSDYDTQQSEHSATASSSSVQETTADKAVTDRHASSPLRYKVLVVDDNPDFLEFMKGELQTDYSILTATNGQEALSVVLEEHPDLILTDVMMPVMDGNELCKRIKNDPDTANIPVVMLTARLSEENEAESRECGADDYVKKPFDLEQLRQRINQLLYKGLQTGSSHIEPHLNYEPIVSVDEKFVAQATAYIESKLDDTSLTVESMSRGMGMSRVNLYRKMVTVTGKTPSEFIRIIRLRYAERLLMKSQLSVAEIAYKVGFSSPRYFAKCYKELFGYAPSQYKRQK